MGRDPDSLACDNHVVNAVDEETSTAFTTGPTCRPADLTAGHNVGMRKSATAPEHAAGPTPAPSVARGPGGGRKHFLSRDLLVDTAIALMEKHGPEALTFRRIGAELEVAPTAVYRHFADKDELLRALGERLLERELAAYRPGPDWRSTLREAAATARRAYLSHPRVAALAVVRVTTTELSFRLADICLGALRDAGLDEAAAARHYLALVDLTLGSAALEATFAGLDPRTREADDAAWGKEFLTAPADTYPHLAASAPHLTGAFRDDWFEVILELFLDAVQFHADA